MEIPQKTPEEICQGTPRATRHKTSGKISEGNLEEIPGGIPEVAAAGINNEILRGILD